jgi:hypothetical protein
VSWSVNFYKYRRTRRLPSNYRGRKRNNLRDLFSCIIISISRAREYRFRIGNRCSRGEEFKFLITILKCGREPGRNKPEL